MALLDKNNNYIRVVPYHEIPEIVEVFAYEGIEHRLKEKTSESYLQFLLLKSEELKELRYNEMIDHLLSLEGVEADSLSTDKEQEYLAKYPSLLEKKLLYNEVFNEYIRLNDYFQRRIPPQKPFPHLEQFIGEQIPFDTFIESPQIIGIAVGKPLEDIQQAYEEVKALKIFGETRDT